MFRKQVLAVALMIATLAALTLAGCNPKSEPSDGAKAEEPDPTPSAEPAAPAAAAPAEAAPTEPATAEAAPTEAAPTEAAPADADRLAPGETRHFGGEFALDTEPLALADALGQVDALLGKPVKVTGQVEMACRKKGCWMTLEPTADGAVPVRVTFKDYKFFVPKFADGSSAVLEGEFVQETLSEATRRHLARDAGKSDAEVEAITGDEHIVQFVATAVDLTGPAAAP